MTTTCSDPGSPVQKTDDHAGEVVETIAAMIGHAPARCFDGDLDRPLWERLSGAGFHLLDVPEAAGGSGGDLTVLVAALDVLGYHAASVPLAECVLAGWLVARSGLRLGGGITLVATTPVLLSGDQGDERLDGSVTVPWGRYADDVVVTARRDDGSAAVAVLPVGAGQMRVGVNVAGEPRDELMLRDTQVRQDRIVALPDPAGFGRRGALVRAAQMSGAARAVLDASVRHAGEREQFGRPLAAFQAVKHHLTTLAGESALMRMAVDSAVLAQVAASGDVELCAEADLAVAMAKAATSAGAGVVATAGHQVHGAIGYAREHDLGRLTTRLWSWREEFGSEGAWQDRIAESVLTLPTVWRTIAGPATTMSEVAP